MLNLVPFVGLAVLGALGYGIGWGIGRLVDKIRDSSNLSKIEK